jgi:site-specific recombinase XerD
MPLELVSKMLGHENLDTTKIYLDLSNEDVKRAHERFVT